jgi:hypothetical protein
MVMARLRLWVRYIDGSHASVLIERRGVGVNCLAIARLAIRRATRLK